MLQNSKLEQITDRFAELEKQLTAGHSHPDFVRFSREYNALRPIVEAIESQHELERQIDAAKSMLSDPELRPMAEEEISELTQELQEKSDELLKLLLPSDSDANRSAILEIRAGTGGDEAALFAGDLLRMYERYSQQKGWSSNVLSATPSQTGGFREVAVDVRGKGAFARLRYESGVHRVQRVPATESAGRVHTSAATVAVLPEADEVEVEILPSDLRIETMRASGAGGQHVNKTDSAVRITHLPSGIVVSASEKSQHQNRASAMKVLRSRLYEMEQARATEARANARRQQVGEGDRSEKIRTYNFPEGRVTDHRINLKLHRIEQIMDGGLDDLVDALIAHDQARRLAQE